jgi:hypothetical protein
LNVSWQSLTGNFARQQLQDNESTENKSSDINFIG